VEALAAGNVVVAFGSDLVAARDAGVRASMEAAVRALGR